MQSKIHIRPAAQSDFENVAAVWHESASQIEAAASNMPSVVDLRARIDHEIENGWLLFVAERSDMVVGMLALRPNEARLDQIFVHPSFQGSGIGAELVKEAKRQMPSGFNLRMAESNKGAAGFYEHLGLKFVKRGRHPVSGNWVCYYQWKIA